MMEFYIRCVKDAPQTGRFKVNWIVWREPQDPRLYHTWAGVISFIHSTIWEIIQ